MKWGDLATVRKRRGALITIHESTPRDEGSAVLQDVRLTARSGLAVQVSVRRERADSGQRLPAVVIPGGHVTGSEAARMVGSAPGVTVVAVSYPFTGDPRPGGWSFSGRSRRFGRHSWVPRPR